MDDTDSSTSVDDNSEGFYGNATRDILAEGLMGLIKPTVDQLEEKVQVTRNSQKALLQCLNELSIDLDHILESLQQPQELNEYVEKIVNTRQRVIILHNILKGVQDRLDRIKDLIEKEKLKRNNEQTTGEPAQS